MSTPTNHSSLEHSLTNVIKPLPPVRRLPAENANETTARFGRLAVDPAPGEAPTLLEIHGSPEFTALRDRYRRFVFLMVGLFFGWYLLYTLMAAYAHDFMSQQVVGRINVGLVFGLLQFVSTAVITVLYNRFARRHLDPGVEAIREQAGAR